MTADKIIDYRELIERATAGFVGRQWVRDAVDRFLRAPGPRTFLLKGEPGCGKTAFLASLVRERGYPHHFIGKGSLTGLAPSLDWRNPVRFAESIGYQLLRDYGGWIMDWESWGDIHVEQEVKDLQGLLIGALVGTYQALPRPAGRPSLTVRQEVERFGEAARVVGVYIEKYVMDVEQVVRQLLTVPLQRICQRYPDHQVVLVVDGLDEAEGYSNPAANILRLLPAGEAPPHVRLVVSSRPGEHLTHDYQSGCQVFWLSEDEEGQLDDNAIIDAEAFVLDLAREEPVRAMLARKPVAPAELSSQVATASRGNFLYLYHYAQGLRAGDERLLDLASLPQGLYGIYSDFLARIKARREDISWDNAYKPLLGTLAVAREPLARRQLATFSGVAPQTAGSVLVRLEPFRDPALQGIPRRYALYHKSFGEFLISEENEDYIDGAQAHRRILQAYRGGAASWAGVDWSRCDDYGWAHLLAHAGAAGRDADYQSLFDLCDGGFLAAKRRAVAGLPALEDDWARVFRACRAAGDWGRAARYGLERVRQFGEVAYLINSRAARTAALLAVKRGDHAAVDRLAAEIEMIAQPSARLDGRRVLFQALLAGMPDHPLVPTLDRNLRESLDFLPPGGDRDHFLSEVIPALAAAHWPGWQHTCRAELEQARGLRARTTLLATLARQYAADGNPAGAAALLVQALDECRRFDLYGDDIVRTLFGTTGAAEPAEDPAETLAGALEQILRTLPLLDRDSVGGMVTSARRLAARLEDEAARSRLQALAVTALHRAGLRSSARRAARRLLDRHLLPDAGAAHPDWEPDVGWFPDDAARAVELLTLLPAVELLADRATRDRWLRTLNLWLGRIQSPLDLRWVLAIAAEAAQDEVRRPALRQVLPRLTDSAAALAAESAPETMFPVTATLAATSARVGDRETAPTLLEQILDGISAADWEPWAFPAPLRERSAGLIWTWRVACDIGEPGLLDRALDWLLATVPVLLPRQERVHLWSAAVEILAGLPDAGLATALLDRLKLPLTGSMDAGGYVTTAWLQLAEAYTGLDAPQEAQRLAGESIRIARTRAPLEAWSLESLVEAFARAAGVYAALGDAQTGATLLAEALDFGPPPDGTSQATCLRLVLGRLEALSASSPLGREKAGDLLAQVAQRAATIHPRDHAVTTLAAAVHTALDAHLPAPLLELRDLAQEYLDEGDEGEMVVTGPDGSSFGMYYRRDRTDVALLRAVMGAIAALHRADADAAGSLLAQVERAVEDLPHATDSQRAQACQARAELAALWNALGRNEPPAPWYDQAADLARQVEDPGGRIDARVALVHLEAQRGDSQSAANWLAAAVEAWQGIGDWFYASHHVTPLFQAWAAISDPGQRRAHLDTMAALLWRIPDPVQRDGLEAQLAISLWDDPGLFARLSARVTGQEGLDRLLTAFHVAGQVPEGLLPATLFDLIEKASRQPSGIFAGSLLLATQIRVRRGLATPQVDLPILASVEATIRDIAPLPALPPF
jgi:hypothetical protein